MLAWGGLLHRHELQHATASRITCRYRSSAGVSSEVAARRIRVKVLALMLLRSDCSPASKVQQLQELATAASPPEDQPVCSLRIHSAVVSLPFASHARPDRQPDAHMRRPALAMCVQVQLQPLLRPCIWLVSEDDVLCCALTTVHTSVRTLGATKGLAGRRWLRFHRRACCSTGGFAR